jgi:hypothetical protein
MNSQELATIVRDDLEKHGKALRWGGRPIDECLLTPRKEVFTDSFNDNEPIELWAVFKESPGDQGYTVIYSEEEKEFGLAVPRDRAGVLIGIYGGFVETLQSM